MFLISSMVNFSNSRLVSISDMGRPEKYKKVILVQINKLDFQGTGGWGGGQVVGSVGKIFATMSCIPDSLKFDKQHDHVLKS